MAAQNAMNAGAKGIRIEVAGRLNNAEMARREKLIEGSVPLHTLRADIDFHAARANAPGVGIIGVKVWVWQRVKELIDMLLPKKTKYRKVVRAKTRATLLVVTT